ncbi:hypothetical protein [Bacillus sp. JJ1474]|uniref:hypothetical protein n=1 Tax=Bacillus sp. JJ1474 TaxID=3122955 RepID=UPI002FFFDC65
MKVIIETHTRVEGTGNMRRGEFFVNDQEFKEDPDFTVGVVAYEWIEQQKRETGFRDTDIEKVIWNEVNDITELVKQIKPIDPVDDLPF